MPNWHNHGIFSDWRTFNTTAMDQAQLVAKYKKDGFFDEDRKALFDAFSSSDNHATKTELNNLILSLVKIKIEKDPYLLTKNKGKISALIQTELVKRHVETFRVKATAAKTHKDATDNASAKLPDGSNTENEILDKINSLLDAFAEHATTNSEFQQIVANRISS